MVTQKELKQLIHYNPDTGLFTWLVDCGPGRPNQGDIAGRTQIKSCGKSYHDVCINKKRYYAHRLAWLYMTGEWPVDKVDHDDGNGVNNKWSNLNAATNIQNGQNVRKRIDNRSGCTGVHLHQSSGKWQVYINENKIRYHLGLFSDFFEAVCIRKSAERKHNFNVNHGQVRPL